MLKLIHNYFIFPFTAFALFSCVLDFAPLPEGYHYEYVKYFYVKNGQIIEGIARRPTPDTGFFMHQGCFRMDWIFKYGKKLTVEGCNGANGVNKRYANWAIDNIKAVEVKRPRGIPKGFTCVREQRSSFEPITYCVGDIKEYLE